MGNKVSLIPARGGSKRLPGKNVAFFNGKPLIAWSIEASLKAGLDTYVSTENRQYANIAFQCGAHVIKRPKELAKDNIPMSAVMDHFNNLVTWETLVLLQPTSPLRTAEHIQKGLTLLDRHKFKTVTAFTRMGNVNGSLYIWTKKKGYKNAGQIILTKQIDIDTMGDFERAEAMHGKTL